jgi:predicted hydrolase (HD superfamily)
VCQLWTYYYREKGPGALSGVQTSQELFPDPGGKFLELFGETVYSKSVALFAVIGYTLCMSALRSSLSRDRAWELLKKHNKDLFHLQHALTVEGVMKWYAQELGFAGEIEFWGNVGLLHDIDFEEYPEEHCLKAPELLRSGGAEEALIHAVCSHGWGLTTVEAKPEHLMEKVLFAADELTGLIWAAAIIRPSKSVMDLEVKSVKKKYKALNFAAGCNREVIDRGAAELGWDLDKLIEKTILAMRSCEAGVCAAMAALNG